MINPPQLKQGDKVLIKSQRDKIGIITNEPFIMGGEYWYRVFFSKTDSQNYPESNLELFMEYPEVNILVKNNSFSSKQTLVRVVLLTRLQTPLSNNVYALFSSRTQFLPYQFKPVLKILDSEKKRLLIADEVGLGKTIEAGLIILEELARHDLKRIIVVCPSSLTLKWEWELKNKFDLEFSRLNRQSIEKFLEDVAEKGDLVEIKGIISLQTLRSRGLQEKWKTIAPQLDIVIVDEAHHMRNVGTLSHKLGRILSENADLMLLLTATPIHLGSEDLFNLLRILDSEEFNNYFLFNERISVNRYIMDAMRYLRCSPPDFFRCMRFLEKLKNTSERNRFGTNPIYKDVLYRLSSPNPNSREFILELLRDINSLNVLSHILTRSKKRDLQMSATRKAIVYEVKFSPEEMEFYNAVTDYVITRYQSKGWGKFGTFVSIMPQRQVASCIQAMIEKYKKDLSYIVDEETDLNDYLPDEIIEKGKVVLLEEEKEAMKRILSAAGKIGHRDSKFEKLLEALEKIWIEEPQSKVIIFSYFRGTLTYLFRRMREYNIKCVLISGQIPKDNREEIIQNFREDTSIKVMLSSEVGSEGLDLQFCHHMVNYDLPWNPMKVEQRIGRLDRIGQESQKIIIVNFKVEETIEERILTRLYERIKIFEESIGDLEQILGKIIRDLTVELLSRKLTSEEQNKLIEKKAIIIVNKRKEWEELEKQSSKFIGHDQFFLDEIERIKRNNRYISSEDLITLVEDFLRNHFPQSYLRKTKEENICFLKVSNDLKEFIKNNSAADQSLLTDFLVALYKASGRGMKVTFDSETALQHPKLHFINIYHPLISAIKKYYEANPGELHPVSKILVESQTIPPGIYLYLLYLVDLRCARPKKLLEPVFISFNDSLPTLKPEKCETLLTEMILKGKTWDEFYEISRGNVEQLLQKGQEIFAKRMHKKKEEMERINSALVATKLDNLKKSYEAKKRERETRLKKARDTRIIRMLEASLRNLEKDYEKKRKEIERMKEVKVSFDLQGGGIVNVIRG